MNHLFRSAAIGALLFPIAFAQGPTTGSIAGTVTDSSGAIIAIAKVTVHSTALVVAQSTLTSGQGTYRFPSLPPGEYSITFEAPGFSVGKKEGIALTSGFSAAIDMPMTLAGQVQTVAVMAEAAILDTENTKIQNTFGKDTLDKLSAQSFQIVGRVLIEVLKELAGGADGRDHRR